MRCRSKTVFRCLPWSFVALLSCSGQLSIGEGSLDAGHRPDSSRGDAQTHAEAGSDGSLGDGVTVLQSGQDFLVYGVTSDGFVVYSLASTMPTLMAASVTGGTPMTIGTVSSESFFVEVVGNAVVVFDSISQEYQAAIKVWSSTTPLTILSSSAYSYAATVSSQPVSLGGASGPAILYTTDYDPDTATAQIVVSALDGSASSTLTSIAGLTASTTDCFPQLAFVASQVLVASCVDGVETGNIDIFTPPTTGSTWMDTTVAEGVLPFARIDPTGRGFLFSGSTGLSSVNTADSPEATVLLDPAGTLGLYTGDGARAVYTTDDGALRVSPAYASSPTTLLPTGAEGLVALSPDNTTALVYESYDSSTSEFALYAAATSNAGPLLALDSMASASTLFGSFFSADSSRALFLTNVHDYLGDLTEADVATGAMATLGTAVSTVWAVSGSIVAYADDTVTPVGSSISNADIELVNVGGDTPGAPKRLASGVNTTANYASFFVWQPAHGASVAVYATNDTTPGVCAKSIVP